MKRVLTVIALCAAVLTIGREAGATTITIDTNQTGWWSETLSRSSTNPNYATGRFQGFPDDAGTIPPPHVLRSFFNFDLASVVIPAGEVLVSATLELARHTYLGSDASETIEFFHVSTAAGSLLVSGTNQSIYDDLGAGTSYGSQNVNLYQPTFVFGNTEPNPNLQTLTFALNGAALADIAAAIGVKFFSVGGAIQTVDLQAGTNQGLFGFSHKTIDGSNGIQRLVLETAAVPVPEPASMLLFGTGLAAASIRRYRRR